jgi:hypothetical protein
VADKRVGVVIEGKAAVAPAFREVKKEFDLLKATSKQLTNVMTGIGQGIGQAIAGFGADALGRITGVFTEAIPQAMSYAKHVADIAKVSGATAEEASRLVGVLEILGTNVEALEPAFRQMAEEIINNEQKFTALGIAVRDNSGNLLDTVTILDSTRSALSKMENGATKTALAADLFGKTAHQLSGFLMLTDDAVASANDELERMGLILDKNALTNAKDAARAFNLLDLTFKGLQIQLGNMLIPAIIDVVMAIRELVMANKDGLLNVLSEVAGAITGFISGLVGAGGAVREFLESLHGVKSGVDTTKAGILAQIQALQQQKAAYLASASGAGAAGGASDRLAAALSRQINKLREQRNALMDVARARAAEADAAFASMLAGLDAQERAYQLEQRRKELNGELVQAQQEQADGAAQAARELQLLREEAQLAIAGEADPDKQFRIASDYAMREQRLIEQHAEEATRLEKAVADRRKAIADFEVEVRRQAALEKARAEIEAAQQVSSKIQELAVADGNFKANIAELQGIRQQLIADAELARQQGNSLLLQAIEQNLAQVRDAIRTQEEARRIKQHERELERQKEKLSSQKKVTDAILASLNLEIKRLEDQLKVYDNTNTKRMDAVNLQERLAQRLDKDKPGLDKYVQSFKDWAVAGDRVARALERILRAIEGIASIVGFGEDLLNLIPSFNLFNLVPRRAKGGPVSMRKPYVVGEEGPELFVPNSSGNIVPNGALGGGQVSVTIQAGAYLGSAADAREFAQRVYGAMQEEGARRYSLQPRGAF